MKNSKELQHQPWCAYIIGINAELPFEQECDCQENKDTNSQSSLHSEIEPITPKE